MRESFQCTGTVRHADSFIDALVCLKTAIMPVKMQRERWTASALHPMHTVGTRWLVT